LSHARTKNRAWAVVVTLAKGQGVTTSFIVIAPQQIFEEELT